MHTLTTSTRRRSLILTGILSALAVSYSGLSAAADSEPVRSSGGDLLDGRVING